MSKDAEQPSGIDRGRLEEICTGCRAVLWTQVQKGRGDLENLANNAFWRDSELTPLPWLQENP